VTQQQITPIQISTRIGLSVAQAFELFTSALQTWWPREYTWSGAVLDRIGIEPGAGGFCYERGPHGFRCDWGRVQVWDAPRRLVFTWQIGPHREPVPDPARASEIEVRFVADAGAARVNLEHGGFERYGEGAVAYRTALASPQGWPYILQCFVEASTRVTAGML
jgi:uncharacterized protein YndB with AHSA1/START domain